MSRAVEVKLLTGVKHSLQMYPGRGNDAFGKVKGLLSGWGTEYGGCGVVGWMLVILLEMGSKNFKKSA